MFPTLHPPTHTHTHTRSPPLFIHIPSPPDSHSLPPRSSQAPGTIDLHTPPRPTLAHPHTPKSTLAHLRTPRGTLSSPPDPHHPTFSIPQPHDSRSLTSTPHLAHSFLPWALTTPRSHLHTPTTYAHSPPHPTRHTVFSSRAPCTSSPYEPILSFKPYNLTPARKPLSPYPHPG